MAGAGGDVDAGAAAEGLGDAAAEALWAMTHAL